MDHVDHAVDLLAVLGQALNHLGGLLHACGQPGNRLLHTNHHFLATAGQGVGRLREVAGGAGVLGDVVHGGGHFIDCRGRLVGFALLAEHAVSHLVHARGQARRADIELPGSVGHGVDHPLITGLHRVECAGHLADFVGARQRHPCGQVAGFLNVQHDVFQGVELAEQETDQQLRGAEHRQHQDEHRHRVIDETFAEHLDQARSMGDHGDALTIGAGQHLGTHQRVLTEQRHRMEFDPAVGVRQCLHGLPVQHRRLATIEGQQVVVLGQRLPGRPGGEQSRLGLGRCLRGVAAGLLLELYGVQHQQQGGDEGDRVDRPKFIFQRDIAKPGTHGGLL
ncbi:hypothetical protein D3C73_1038450 [compost metagenome]